MSADIKDLTRRMHGAIEVLRKEFAGLRTGRASAGLLETITVEAYGARMPISQVASISVPEARMLTVQVWDNSMVKAVERGIRESELGLNPQPDGALIRVPIPELSEERRVELSKVAGRYGEQARVAVRNVRRDGMDSLKKLEKDGEIPKDEQHDRGEDIQSLTDKSIKEIDEMQLAKEKEIMQV